MKARWTLFLLTVANWTENNAGVLSAGSSGLTSSSSMGGSLISTLTTQNNTPNYNDVKMVLNLTATGGNFITYLRASSNALAGSAGTFYAVQLSPTFSGSSCSAVLSVFKNVSNVTTTLYTTTVPCGSTTVVRSVYTKNGYLVVYVNSLWYFIQADISIAGGQPGVGVNSSPGGNTISEVDLAAVYTGAPAPVNTELLSTNSFPNRVDMQWEGAAEPQGPGVAWYQFYRGPAGGSLTWLANLNDYTNFEDTTVAAGTSYTYQIIAYDYHLNISSVTFNVDTPPAGSLDPRQVGVKAQGSYWGGAGEQIDMRSGNLNYTMPLLKAMGRGGWGVGISLSYNSQNWRRDTPANQPAVTWQFGRDLGYGYGWTLQAGSLTAVYSSYWTIHHWQFVDATGAEYRLDTGGVDPTNNHLVWTSSEGVYVYYDATAARLYFKDGSFWVFNAISAGIEEDAGIRYPTLMEDSNGNQIILAYDQGVGTTWTNSSSRILTVEDVRSKGSPSGSYQFTYNRANPNLPQLSSIANNIGTSENYSFTYTTAPLNSPFDGTNYPNPLGNNTTNWSFLYQVTNTTTGLGTANTFTYDSSGQMAKIVFPYGGYFRYTYLQYTLLGNRTLSEVYGRYLSWSGNGETPSGEATYALYRGNDGNLTYHTFADLIDFSGGGEKVWWFQTTTPSATAGLQTDYEERQFYSQNNRVALRHVTSTWAQDGSPSNSNYISNSLSTQYWNGGANQIQSQTSQTVDQYGNLLTAKFYNYGNLSTAVRTYTNTYLSTTQYTGIFIRNRLLTSTVTDGTTSATLATNSYDASAPVNITGSLGEHDSTYNTSVLTRGNATSTTTPAGYASRTFDIAGNVASSTANGVTTTSNTNTNVSTNFAAPSTLTTNTLSTTLGWSTFLGLQSQTGPNGDTGSVVYDPTARPQSSTSPYGAQTKYTYSDTASPPVHTATTNGHWVRTQLDGFGRTMKTTTGYGTGAGTVVSIVDTNYAPCGCSPVGKMSQVSQPYVSGTAVWTTYAYDGVGRTLTATLADGSATQYSYLGNQVTVTDPAGKRKTYTMDVFGNLTNVAETDPSLGAVTTTYSYDVLNHLIGVSMPRGSTTQTRTFNYMQGPTLTGYLQSATNPENGTVSYVYNSNGQVTTKTDAKNQQIQYSYDSYGRLTQVRHYPVAGQAEDTSQQVNYYYDTNPFDTQGFSKNILGRLAAVTYSPVALKTQNPPLLPLFAEWYSYVQAGGASAKRLQVQQPLLPGQGPPPILNFDANYTFDSQGEGKIASVQYPTTNPSGNTIAGPTYTYTFDSMGRPSTLTDQSNNTIVNGVNYSAANELTAIGYPFLAYTENRTYNSLLQLTGITFQSGSQYSVNLTYAYPTGANNGKISSMTDAVTGETVQYTYDSLNRLILAQTSSATTPWGQGFSYDAFGNLTGKSVTLGSAPTMSLQVNPATNQAVGVTDANGNWTGILPSTPNYAYDVENRMQQANPVGGGTVYLAYDTQNRRVWQWNGGLNQYGDAGPYTIYFYGVNGQRLASYTVNVAYVQPGLTLESQVVVQDKYFGAKRIAPMDRVGSARGAGTNSAGYYPFGEDKGTPGANDSWKFGTYWRDSATGLDYAMSRYYSSTLGRFMTPDQHQASGGAQSPQSWNRYGYVTGDPINLHDPKGQFETAPGDDSSCWLDDYGNMVCPGQGGTPYCADSGYYYNPGTGNCDPEPAYPQSSSPALACVNWGCMPPAFARAMQALTLNPGCFDLFGTAQTRSGKWNPTTVLTGLFFSQDGTYGSVNFNYTGNGAALTTPSGVLTPSLTSGVRGSRATVSFNSSYWNVDNVAYNAETLLHEMGHVYNWVRGSGNFALSNFAESSDSQAFDKLIEKKCNIYF